MKILVTGFDIWGSVSINPSWEMVKNLPTSVGGHTIRVEKIPVVYSQIKTKLDSVISSFSPDLIIAFGLADSVMTPRSESYGWNYGASGRDATGVVLNNVLDSSMDVRVGYKTTFDYSHIQRWGLPETTTSSDDAGDFLCNAEIYYIGQILQEKSLSTPFMFTHVPNTNNMSISRLEVYAKKMITKAVSELNENVNFDTPTLPGDGDTEAPNTGNIERNLINNASPNDYNWDGRPISYRTDYESKTGTYKMTLTVENKTTKNVPIVITNNNFLRESRKDVDLVIGKNDVSVEWNVDDEKFITEVNTIRLEATSGANSNLVIKGGTVKYGRLV